MNAQFKNCLESIQNFGRMPTELWSVITDYYCGQSGFNNPPAGFCARTNHPQWWYSTMFESGWLEGHKLCKIILFPNEVA